MCMYFYVLILKHTILVTSNAVQIPKYWENNNKSKKYLRPPFKVIFSMEIK